MYPVLRRRNFLLLWLGGLGSSGGDWLVSLVLPFYVYQRTGSAIATGAMFIANMLPTVLFGSVGGVFADRWDRRRAMLLSDLARAALMLLLLPVARYSEWLWLAYPLVAVESTISQLFLPAKGALLPRLVPQEELLSANSLDAVGESVLRLLAPPLGGLLFGLLGIGSLLLIDAASYLCSALTVALLRVPASHETSGRIVEESTAAQAASRWVAFWQDWLDSLRVVRRHPLLATVFVVGSIAGVGNGILGPLLLIFVQDVLHQGAVVLGWIVSATGVGTLLAGLILGRLGRMEHLARLVMLQQLLLGAALFATFSVRSAAAVIALQVLVGIGFATRVGIRTLLQACTTEEYRGRVLGAYGTTFALAVLIGQGLGSVLAAPFGPIPVLYATSVLFMLAGLLGLALLATKATGEQSRSEGEIQAL